MKHQRFLYLSAAILAGAVALCSRAEAHVRVTPAIVEGGRDVTLVFHCPNERSTASTTELVVQMPTDIAIVGVRVPASAGWESRVTMRPLPKPIPAPNGIVKEVVDTITWSKGHINPGERHDFEVIAGPMPAAPSQLIFKALQTYSNGEIVRWIQVRNPGESIPPFPAPTVEVK
jgi:uncharacterized protein YcnI